MASSPVEQQWQAVQSKINDAIRDHFPVEGRRHQLVLNQVHIDESSVDHADIQSQEKAKLNGRTWGASVYGDLSLVDKTTGKEVDRQKVKLMTLPKLTSRFSYIVDGQEKQVDSLWKLRSGIYAHQKQNGQYQAEFNLQTPFVRDPRLYIPFDPEKKQFRLKHGTSYIPLYSILRTLGVSDQAMKKAWGEEIYNENLVPEKKVQDSISKFYDRLNKKGVRAASDSFADKATAVVEAFGAAKLLPDTTKAVLGKPIDHVNGEALLLASQRILAVARQDIPQDDRDSLVFKNLHSVDDFLFDKLTKYQTRRTIQQKIGHNIDRQTKVGDIVSSELFHKPIHEFFAHDTLSRNPDQVNPLEIISNHRATTIIAPESGGIKNERSVAKGTFKLINPSHLGFLDPIHTPESPKIGISLHLPLGVRKQGNEAQTLVYDLHEHKLTHIAPTELHTNNVVMPDQVKWKGQKPHPISDAVKMKDPTTHEIVEKPFKDGRYLIISAHQLFDEATNLIPFLQNNSGNRTMTGSRQATQAVSLHYREKPLVQVKSGTDQPWERIVGTSWAHESPVDGKVVGLKNNPQNGHPDAVVVQDNAGKKHTIQLYNHFPLNDPKSYLHASLLVKPGEVVKKGQVLADTNFTRDGHLTLGTNLRVSYLPAKGYNFEDGIVISESAAKKLTSEHMHRHSIELDPERDHLDKKKFAIYASTTEKRLTKEQADKLGDDGIVRVGSRVKPGDILMAAVGKRDLAGEAARTIGRLDKKMFSYQDKSILWDSQHEGEVVKVIKSPTGKGATVFVKTLEPAEIGDKMVGRHGNKGIITRILPDSEMPRIGSKEHTGDNHAEVLMNPTGVPSRINLGQMLETAAAKIAKKTGQPYMVQNFSGGNIDHTEKVKADLAKHGLSDQETLYDPSTGKKLGSALTGHQYIMKLHHQVEKKLSVRGGGSPRYSYTVDMAPKGTGAEFPGQAIGQLELYAMLAHGARANLREMATYKAGKQSDHPRDDDSHIDFWHRVQTGQPLPAPKPTFAYKKFEAYLTGLGLNVRKDGHQLVLQPLTDKGVLAISNGEIKDAGRVLRGKDAKELEKGLFDPKITGGLPNDIGKGTKWSHIALPEPVPNPVFVGTLQHPGPAVILSGLKFNDFEEVARGKKYIDGKTGGLAIQDLLKKIDVKKELQKTQEQMSKLRGTDLDKANRKAKYLLALDQLGMKPHDAYTIQNVPVLPPVFRPIVPMQDGTLRFDDINHYYKSLGHVAGQLRTAPKELGDEHNQDLREQMYDLTKSLAGIPGGTPVYESSRKLKGILDEIAGEEQPKHGFFQRRLMKRRQDLSMRSTIIPEPAMHLDHVGLPKDAAMELYKPFVVRELQRSGYSPIEALKEIKQSTPLAWKSLDAAMDKRPVLLKRDPALHKFSIMAFKPKVVEGKAIQIHPLVTAGYNADFDGDSIDLDTPIPFRYRKEFVVLRTGRHLFDELGGQENYIAQFENGLEAYTYDGWKPVKSISFHSVEDKKKYRITLKNGFSFTVSEDHSLMSRRREKKPTELQVGDELDHVNIEPLPFFAHPHEYEQGVAFGNFLGDGCAELRRQGGGRISIACQPEIERRYLMDIWRNHFQKANPSPYVFGFHVNGVELAKQFLHLCGRYCDRKYVGDALLNKSTEFLKGLLAGYILADGSVEVTRSGSYLIRTWSRSKMLRDGMSFVANMLGLPHSVRERTAKGEVNYIISFGKEAIKLIDYRCAGKKGDLIRKALSEYENNRNDDRSSLGERWYEIKAIEEVNYTGQMIDIEVDDPSHVFAIHGGIIVHNTMSAFVPLTDDAVREAHRMFPSNNLFSSTHGGIMYAPDQEALLGLNLLSKWGKDSGKTFSNYAEAKKARDHGQIDVTDVIKVGPMRTTIGRLMIGEHLPETIQDKHFRDLIQDPKFELVKYDGHGARTGVHNLLERIAKHDPKNFSTTVDSLKDLGNKYSYEMGFSFGLNDLHVHKELRNKILEKYDSQAAQVKKDSKLTPVQKNEKLISLYDQATQDLVAAHKPLYAEAGNNIFTMVDSGARGKMSQFRQMTIAPMLMKDGAGRTIPTPVKRSFSEGLDIGDYWTSLHGARMGTLQRVEGTSKPGQLTKDIINVVIPNMIVSKDCGTSNGISLNINDPDVHDRYLAAPVKLKSGQTLKAGTLIDPNTTALLHKNDVSQVVVRSPLKCQHGHGMCAKCFGLNENGHLHEVGTNVGVLAGHALGEPATQLAMDSFHTGGVAASRGGGAQDKFTRLNQLLVIPNTLPNAAVLAKASGTIHSVEKDKATNGWNVVIRNKTHAEEHFIPAERLPQHNGAPLKVGDSIKRGTPISDGNINPRELLRHTDIHTVQNHLADELFNSIYRDERVKRRNIETVVRSLTNLSRVKNPGDSDHLHGDVLLRTVAEEHNRKLKPGEAPIEHEPVLRGINQMALDHHEDWMARLNYQRLRQTILEGAAKGWKTDLHGINPISAYAHGAEFGKGTAKKPHLY